MIPVTSLRAPRWFERPSGLWGRGALVLAAGLAVAAGCGDDSSGTGVTPDYSIAVDPAALTIVAGEAGTSNVTLTRTDFDGEVTFSVSGSPAGILAGFTPTATTGTSSVLTLGVGASVVPGVYPISVRGTSSAGNRARLLTVTVAPPLPDFELSAAPTHVTIAQGGSGTTGIAIARTDFTGPVTLIMTDAPAGVTASFDPAAPTGNLSVLTVTVGAAVPPSIYDITVEGTGTPGTRTTSFVLTVTP